SSSPVIATASLPNMVAFWGCEVTETKAAVVNVPEGFVLNVVNATCGASSLEAQVALGLETQQLDGKSWKGAVAHLGAKQPLQVKLDLVFGHKVKFYLAKGSGVVNLSGYFQPGPSVDLVEEEAIIPPQAPKKSKKRAREEKKEAQKSWDEVSTMKRTVELYEELFPSVNYPRGPFFDIAGVQTGWDRKVYAFMARVLLVSILAHGP
ncbi:hypothetical protein L916_17380, partial [Phytophthora nicotianae]